MKPQIMIFFVPISEEIFFYFLLCKYALSSPTILCGIIAIIPFICHAKLHNIRIGFLHAGHRALQKPILNPIVRIHKINVLSGCMLQSDVSGRSRAMHLGIVFQKNDPGVLLSVFSAYRPAVVRRTVIDQNQFKICVCLPQHGFNRFPQIKFRIIYWYYDRYF